MENIKITMMGNSGAGKTCFMLGMYATMRLGVKGFTFTAKDMDVDLDLSDAWDQMVDTFDESRWPPPTNQTTPYSFEFCYALKGLLGFDWIDYRGGALKTRANAPQQDVQELMKHLQESTCVFLCVSGEHLTESIEGNEQNVQRKAGYDRMLQFLQRLPTSAPKPAIVIVVTKYDLIPENVKKTIKNDLKELFNPFFAPNSGWFTMICPVTLGKALSQDKDGGAIDPKNIHLPVTFSVYYALKRETDSLQGRYDTVNNRLGEKRGLLSTVFGRGKYIKDRATAASYNEEIQEMDKKMKLLVKELMTAASIYYEGNEVELDA